MSNVNHPKYYGGAENTYETIKVIRALELGFSLGNCVKYISRAGKKSSNEEIQDLEKALWYLKEEIEFRKKKRMPVIPPVPRDRESYSPFGDGIK